MKIFHLFLKTVRRFQMFRASRKVYVACSGGPDSTALVYLLMRLKKIQSLELGILHVNHGLRGKASDTDERWVKELARKLGLPFLSGRVNVKQEAKKNRLSIEEAARDVRYRFLIQTAKRHRIGTIVLGHTMDDQVETVLMRFLVGSGLRGLGGSKPVFEREGIQFVRPLTQIPKQEIVTFLKKEKIKYRIDQSNHNLKFLRNRLRLELMPYLEKKINPGIRKIFARLPEVIQNDVDFLEKESRKSYQQLKHETKKHIWFERKLFSELHPAIQFRLLQTGVMQLTREEFAFRHWQSFRELFETSPVFQVSFPGGLSAVVSKSKIMISPLQKKKNTFNRPNGQVLPFNKKIRIRKNKIWISSKLVSKKSISFKKKREDYAFLDADELKEPLTIRYRKPGDLFQPLGQNAPFKLKNFLINRKIPKEKRDLIPLVVSGADIVWVAGVGISECAKVTQQTRKLLELKILS